METSHFWEVRARRFAGDGAGLKAVCSYAMPGFYNWAIDVTQRAALKRVIDSIAPGDRVLDYGCGVGRWTREIARRGAHVTAVDFSATMLHEARRRTTEAGLGGRCVFGQMDVTRLDTNETYDVIIGVTVLQHVLEDGDLAQTIGRLARHLRPGGRLIMVEAAPSQRRASCDTPTFQARSFANYQSKIVSAGLRVTQVRGVDPSPLKLWVVPRFRQWPKSLAFAALVAATLVSLPFDLLLAPLLPRLSWHKVIVSRSAGGPP